jgi:hypothetical protein
MSYTGNTKHGILSTGKSQILIDEALSTPSSTASKEFAIIADGLVVGLYATSVTGSATVKIKTYDGDTSKTPATLLTFTVNSASTEWEVKRTDKCLSRVVVEVEYTSAIDLRVVGKPVISGTASEEAKLVSIESDTSKKANTAIAVRTLITTTATRIVTPDEAEYMRIKHIDTSRIVWIGSDASIVAGGSNTYPLGAGEVYEAHLYADDANEIYAITEEGQAYVYAIGGYIE